MGQRSSPSPGLARRAFLRLSAAGSGAAGAGLSAGRWRVVTWPCADPRVPARSNPAMMEFVCG
jgi:hypothetical protein